MMHQPIKVRKMIPTKPSKDSKSALNTTDIIIEKQNVENSADRIVPITISKQLDIFSCLCVILLNYWFREKYTASIVPKCMD